MEKVRLKRTICWLIFIGLTFLGLMTILRGIKLLNFPIASSEGSVDFFKLFGLGLRFDLRVVSIGCLISFLFGLVPFLNSFRTQFGKRFQLGIWGLFSFLFVLFYLTDFGYYAYLHTSLNADILNLAAEGRDSWGMVSETYPLWGLIGILLFIPTLLFGWIYRLYKKVAKSSFNRLGGGRNWIWGLTFFLICGFFIFGRIGQYPLRWSDAFVLGNNQASNMALNPFQSFFSTLKNRNAGYDLKKVQKAFSEVSQLLSLPSENQSLDFTRSINPVVSRDTPPNVVIVICESFSFVKSSMSGNDLNPTPFFKSLSDSGLFFTRCFSPSNGTARGVWAVLTGIPDVDLNGTSSRNPAAVNQRTIVNDFKNYDKSYYIGGSLSWANIRAVLKNNIPGLKTIEQPDYDAPKLNVWGVSDFEVFKRANSDFAKANKPFLAIIQTADNHRPFTIPKENLGDFQPVTVSKEKVQENGFLSLDELNAFRYTDFCFQTFIEQAKKEDYFANTIFVFVGDHGTTGNSSKYFPSAWTEGRLNNNHIPLLFYAPSLIQPQKMTQNVSQLDLLPTLSALAGVDGDNYTLGRNLLDTALFHSSQKDAVFIYDPYGATFGLIKDTLYYAYNIMDPNQFKVYDMRNNQPIHLSLNQQKALHQQVEDYYQTARYLLLENKK